jgi:hypothetical protein
MTSCCVCVRVRAIIMALLEPIIMCVWIIIIIIIIIESERSQEMF